MKRSLLMIWQPETHLQCFSVLAVNVSAVGLSLLLPALDLCYSISISMDGPTLDKVIVGKGESSIPSPWTIFACVTIRALPSLRMAQGRSQPAVLQYDLARSFHSSGGQNLKKGSLYELQCCTFLPQPFPKEVRADRIPEPPSLSYFLTDCACSHLLFSPYSILFFSQAASFSSWLPRWEQHLFICTCQTNPPTKVTSESPNQRLLKSHLFSQILSPL